MKKKIGKPAAPAVVLLAALVLTALLSGCAGSRQISSAQQTADQALEKATMAMEAVDAMKTTSAQETQSAQEAADRAEAAAQRADQAALRAEQAAARAEQMAQKAEAIFMQKMKK